MRYNVHHTYVRTDVYAGIEADTPEEALQVAISGEAPCSDKIDNEIGTVHYPPFEVFEPNADTPMLIANAKGKITPEGTL